jgi:CO/xanthine dehydrogenase Mo-binding subunit
VTSIDWRSYPTLPVGFAVPVVDIVLLNQTDVAACGAGETIITVVAPAIGNAIYDATGARVRGVPFAPARVLAAMNARSQQGQTP